MPAEWSYRGRVVTAGDILFIRQFIIQNAGASRRRLSAKLSEAWEWKQANASLCKMACRGSLPMLHRAGEIELPPVLLGTAPVTEALGALRPVELQPVRRTAGEPLFHSLLEHYPYL
jgi:hypothetical protein